MRKLRVIGQLMILGLTSALPCGTAVATSTSDQLIVQQLQPIYNPSFSVQSIPEPATGAAETSVTYNFTPQFPTFIGPDPNAFTLLMVEPVGSPPDPGETPIQTPYGIVSDLVFACFGICSSHGAIFATMISDGDPSLAPYLALLANAGQVPSLVVTETGQPQLVGNPFAPFGPGPGAPQYAFLASSDVTVPEPGTLLLLGAGLAGLAAAGSRRRNA